MHTLTVTDADKKYIVKFEGTPTLQQVLEQNGITMPHPCGGRGVCGKCVVDVSGNISEPDEKELAYGCRLSCRTKLNGDASVILCTDKYLHAESSTQNIKGCNSQENNSKFGAAVDIGTTTVALSVYDLSSGTILASETGLNPQSTVAADVIGRIDAAMHGHLQEMQDMITLCIRELAFNSGYLAQIDKWIITGNTTMLYLLTGRNPRALSASPFLADHLFGEESLFLGKPLYLPECIHAFVGADITCAILDSGMCDRPETALLCDIGTNGEIALWKEGKLYVSSTAAGPAFEGAGISCGCQSVKGAIEGITLKNDRLQIHTIGNAKAIGLCGSGIIDAIACLLDNGTIDETGSMEEDEAVICEGISLIRADIRNVQLAKAAIAAGIKTLLEITDTKEEELTTCYIAGGFGSHLHIDSAVRIGLLPEALRTKIKVIGNASLKGAASLLTETDLKEKAHGMISNATCINLGGMPEFNDNYIEEMFFTEPKVSCHLLKLAEEIGFSHFGLFNAESLAFRQEVRDMCKAGQCGCYGTRWTCPPHCGTLEESVEKAKKYNTGILLQMTGMMEDDFDVECMQETEQAVKEKLALFVKHLRKEHIECLPMTAGTCNKCTKCTCPDEPCRFPEEAFISMEAYGLLVNDICIVADVKYNYGPKTITFTTCVLFNE